MSNDNECAEDKVAALQERRTRIVGAIRQMLVPAESNVNEEPFLFLSGDRFDFEMIRIAGAWARKLGYDIIFVEFAAGSAVLRPHSIHFVTARDAICWIVREGDLWVDRAGTQVAIFHKRNAGDLVCDGEEMVHVPGKPADVLAPGIGRGRAAILARAEALPIEDARRFYDPFERVAA